MKTANLLINILQTLTIISSEKVNFIYHMGGCISDGQSAVIPLPSHQQAPTMVSPRGQIGNNNPINENSH